MISCGGSECVALALNSCAPPPDSAAEMAVTSCSSPISASLGTVKVMLIFPAESARTAPCLVLVLGVPIVNLDDPASRVILAGHVNGGAAAANFRRNGDGGFGDGYPAQGHTTGVVFHLDPVAARLQVLVLGIPTGRCW